MKPIHDRLGRMLAILIAGMVVAPLIGAIAGDLVIGGRLDKASMAAGLLAQQVVLLTATIWRLKAVGVSWVDLRPYIERVGEAAGAISWGIGLLFLNGLSAQVSIILFQSVFGVEWVESILASEQAALARLLDPEAGALYLGWTVFMAVGVAPVVEEVFFRGYAYRVLKAHAGRHAMWLSAALFAGVHMYVINFLPLFLLGIALAWLYERSGSLSVPIVAHATVNGLVAVIAVLAERSL